MPYATEDVNLFVTDEYSEDADDIDVSDDISDTEQYTLEFVLHGWNDGINIDLKYVEISGDSQTDELWANIYRRRDSSWEDGKQIPVGDANCGNEGVSAGYKIKNIVITATQLSGPGHYKLGLLSSGSTNTFDAIVQGRFF